MIRMIAFIPLVLIIGCASIPKAPETVYVPTYASCVQSVPQKPQQAIPKDKTTAEQVRALLIDLERGKAYQAELEAVVAGCL